MSFLQGLEQVFGTGYGTLKNSRFFRIPGTGSGRNPKFEKKGSGNGS
jgi:hypothetical protein